MPTLAKIAEVVKVDMSNIMEMSSVKNGNQEDRVINLLSKINKKLPNKGDYISNYKINIDAFVGVVLLDRKNRIFLIKEEDKHRISKGRWNLPGGSVGIGESLIGASERETKEETGYKVKISSLVGCYKCKKGDSSWVYVVFKANLMGNREERTDPGVKEGKWFTKEEFLKMDTSKIVHPDMKLVYKIAIENRGLGIESVKCIDYDKE